MRKSYWGIPIFEVAVVLIVASIIGLVLLNRAEEILERTESVAVEGMLMNIRSGLRLEKARRIAAGQGMQGLVASNPLHYLQVPPVGYPGEKLIKSSKTIKSPGWFYADETHVLYYAPKRYAHLSVQGVEGLPVLTWQLRVRAADDVELASNTRYQWF